MVRRCAKRVSRRHALSRRALQRMSRATGQISGRRLRCGCDDSACEYTRVRDSFTLKVLRELPSSYTTPLQQPSIASLIPCVRERTARRCPPCPRDPWVILADIAVGRDCRVRGVDCFAHRRYVVSFADFFFTCRPGATAPIGGIAPIAGNVMLSRAMSSLMGTTNLVDVRMAVSDIPPRATVTLAREMAARSPSRLTSRSNPESRSPICSAAKETASCTTRRPTGRSRSARSIGLRTFQ